MEKDIKELKKAILELIKEIKGELKDVTIVNEANKALFNLQLQNNNISHLLKAIESNQEQNNNTEYVKLSQQLAMNNIAIDYCKLTIKNHK